MKKKLLTLFILIAVSLTAVLVLSACERETETSGYDYTVPTGLTATFGQTLADVTLPQGWAFEAALTTPVGNAGERPHNVVFTPTNPNYEVIRRSVRINVSQATPSYTLPQNLTATVGQTLANVSLPAGWTFEQALTTLVGNHGERNFNTVFTPVGGNHYSIVRSVTIMVSQATPSYTLPQNLTATVGQTLADVDLPPRWAFEKELTTPVGDVGSREFYIIYTPEDLVNFVTVRRQISIEVAKVTPPYTLPQNLIATFGQTLADVDLPQGWIFEKELTTPVGNVGRREFYATYTSEYLINFTSVTRKVTILVFSAQTKISAGGAHSLKIDEKGNLWAWGWNENGLLGDGTTINRISPVQINIDGRMNNARIEYISSGFTHSLAIDEFGNLWAWGWNEDGQLGDGTIIDRLTPVQINIHDARIVSVSAGTSHSLAIDEFGDLWAWGDNWMGELGDGTTISRNSPVQINTEGRMNNARIVNISAGLHHSLAIDEFGNLWAWGDGHEGQLGDGAIGVMRTSPVRINTAGRINNNSVTSISAGWKHSLAIDEFGNLWAWGGRGLVGDGTFINRPNPIQINTSGRINNASVLIISAGFEYSLAIDEFGNLWAWGSNRGQFGDGTTTSRDSPVQINTAGRINSNSVTSISAGGEHSLAIDEFGNLWAWGNLLGVGTTVERRLSPVQINPTNDNMAKISAGWHHSLAIDEFGNLWAWGRNENGQLGDGTTVERHSPLQINTAGRMNNARVISISAGGAHSLAIDELGNLWAWGGNWNGQLGDGTTIDKYSQVQVNTAGRMNNARVISILAGGARNLAIDEFGNLWEWGGWPGGNIPTQVNIDDKMNNARVVSISVGAGHSLAIDELGNLWAWGWNVDGQLGDGTTIDRISPVQINIDGRMNNARIVSVSAGDSHSLAIDEYGNLWAWGSGRLGDGTISSRRNIPVRINILGRKVSSISSSGRGHSLAIDEYGNLWAWGWNENGQLGDGTTTSGNIPVQINLAITNDNMTKTIGRMHSKNNNFFHL
ncbi:MAG: hypothetical protein FWE22_06670 [Firmicutes bacterium]|nr:hypothetical protein [Bacillota bacterium]